MCEQHPFHCPATGTKSERDLRALCVCPNRSGQIGLFLNGTDSSSVEGLVLQILQNGISLKWYDIVNQSFRLLHFVYELTGLAVSSEKWKIHLCRYLEPWRSLGLSARERRSIIGLAGCGMGHKIEAGCGIREKLS